MQVFHVMQGQDAAKLLKQNFMQYYSLKTITSQITFQNLQSVCAALEHTFTELLFYSRLSRPDP